MGHRIIMYFGLALALLVGLFTLWGGLSLGGLTRLGIPEILKYWSIPLLIALGLTFFSVLAKRKPPTKRCSSAAAVAAGVFVLGGYAVLFMETTGVLRLATVSTSAILVGVGYGLLSLVWQHRLSSLAFDDVVKTLLFALVIQSAGYLLLFALLLHALGVKREAVEQDYLATNKYVQSETQNIMDALSSFGLGDKLDKSIHVINSADPRFLHAALDAVEKQYGSLDAYVRDQLSVTDEKREALRARYLTDDPRG